MSSQGTKMVALAVLVAATGACGSDESGSGGSPGGGGPGVGGQLPEPICLDPGEGPYPIAFTDVTADLGLSPNEAMTKRCLREDKRTGVPYSTCRRPATGANVTVADIDGDHWPDLMLTRPTSIGANPHYRENPTAPRGIYHLYRNVAGRRFEEVTWTSGLFTARDGELGRATSFVLWADVDNDGDIDALSAVYADSTSTPELLDATAIFLNDGTGHFTIGPEQSFSTTGRDPISGAAFLDFDRNGMLDLWVGHHYWTYGSLSSSVQDELLAGDGTGAFFDVTVAAGLEQVSHTSTNAAAGINRKPTWGVTACDVDGDGWTDLMAASYGRQLNAFYRNLGNGTFENLTLSSGFGSDDNLDYSDNQFYRCFCEAHPSEPACAGAEPATMSCTGMTNYWSVGSDDQPWRLGGNSSNTVCGDVDADGDMDLLAVELAHWHIGQSSDKTELLLNDGFPAVPLRRPGAAATGIDRPRNGAWNDGDLGGALADFDNDGRLDVVVASSDYPDTTSLLWQQRADGTFGEISAAVGASRPRAHGVSILDFDRDGDMDIVLGTSLARWESGDEPPRPKDYYAAVLRNDSGQNANKLLVHLAGSGVPGGANRDAIGARVTVQANGRTSVHEVQGGYGLTGLENDHLVIVGLGAACTVDELTVRWPNATADEVHFTDVLANYVVVLEEGQPLVYQRLEEFAAR